MSQCYLYETGSTLMPQHQDVFMKPAVGWKETRCQNTKEEKYCEVWFNWTAWIVFKPVAMWR